MSWTGRSVARACRDRLVDPVVRVLARTPAHPLLGRHLVLLRYVGRRTGRSRELPVMAAPAGAELVVVAGDADAKTWWRNFGPDPVEVTVRGGGREESRSLRRLAVTDPGYADALAAYRRTFPRAAVAAGSPVLLIGAATG